MTVFTAAVVAVLYGTGVYMILQRTLTRVVLGLALLVARGEPAADDRRRELGRRPAHRPLHRRGRHRRPDPAGPGAHRHRHQLRRDRLPAGAGLPELAAHPRRHRRGRHRGPPHRGARARSRLAAATARGRRGRGTDRATSVDEACLLPFPVVVPLLFAVFDRAAHRSRRGAAGHRHHRRSPPRWPRPSPSWSSSSATAPRPSPSAAGGAPIGITLVADLFSALHARREPRSPSWRCWCSPSASATATTTLAFHPVYLVLTAGVALSFLTGDLFNLFVSFEMMLTASYVLITLGGRARPGPLRHDLRGDQPDRLGPLRHRHRPSSTPRPAR